MNSELIRYRVRTNPYLCLSPEEALSAGVPTGEQRVEKIHLRENPRLGFVEYAVVQKASLEELKKGQ